MRHAAIFPASFIRRGCFALGLACLVSQALSQNVRPGVVPPPRSCTPRDLSPTLRVYRAPNNVQLVTLDYRNISPTTCIIKPLQVINHVTNNLPAVTIGPGEIVHSSVRMSPENTTPSIPCKTIQGTEFVVYQPGPKVSIYAPSLFPNICSAGQPDEYSPGPFVPSWEAPAEEEQRQPHAPVLIVMKKTFYKNENVELHLQLDDQEAAKEKCPVILVAVQDDRGMYLREDANANFMQTPKGCLAWSRYSGPWRGPANQYPIEVDINGEFGRPTLGDRTVTVFELAGTGPKGEMQLLASNPVAIDIADAASLDRTWGKIDKGMRVDLTLDKSRFTVGEDIPLHLAFENVSAGPEVYPTYSGAMNCFQPSWADNIDFRIKVETADGSPPLYFEPLMRGGSCGSMMVSPIEQGKPSLAESSLASWDQLPRTPGIYKLTASWNVYTKPETAATSAAPGAPPPPPQKPFVTVTSAPVTIWISGQPVN